MTSCLQCLGRLKVSLRKFVPPSVQSPNNCHCVVHSFENVKCDTKGKLSIPILWKISLHKDKQSLMLCSAQKLKGKWQTAPSLCDQNRGWPSDSWSPYRNSHYLPPEAHDWGAKRNISVLGNVEYIPSDCWRVGGGGGTMATESPVFSFY